MNPEAKNSILVVDDDLSVIKLYRRILGDYRNVLFAESDTRALELIGAAEGISLALVDFNLPGVTGAEVVRELKKKFPEAEAIVVTVVDDIQNVVESIKAGADNYLTKPINSRTILSIVAKNQERELLREENERLRNLLAGQDKPKTMVGECPAIRKVLQTVDSIAELDTSVLILGETGTGKDLLAGIIHEKSPRCDKPFIIADCAGFTDTLLVSDLFGHEKGAFTGATKLRKGKFERADGGTIFLNEIGTLTPEAQAKLLQVLQDGEMERLGGERTIRVDVRVIAATNSDLQIEMKNGRFRKDLFFRINTVSLVLPPLRERREDLPSLVRHFILMYSARHGKNVSGLDREAFNVLNKYTWPGNVRELMHVIERGVITATGQQLKINDLPSELIGQEQPESGEEQSVLSLADVEKDSIQEALKLTDYNLSRAAKILGIARSTLYGRLEKHGIQINKTIPQ